MDLMSMTCRHCGGKLKVSMEADQIICQYCGTEYLVSFNEGAISIKLLSEGLKEIQVSTDKTASELALVRIKKEKEQLLSIINNKIVYPLTTDRVLDIPKKVLSEPYTLESYLKDELAREEDKETLFKNNFKIRYLKKYIAVLSELTTHYRELDRQEYQHLETVRRK